MGQGDMTFELRRASAADIDFAWSLYRDVMKPLTEALLEWNEARQKALVEDALAHEGTSVIVVGGSDAGWLQVTDLPAGLYLGQLHILPAMQNRGIGTAVMRQLCNRGGKEGKPVTLEVMKNNPGRRFYERLGFRVTGQSRYKFEMQWREGA